VLCITVLTAENLIYLGPASDKSTCYVTKIYVYMTFKRMDDQIFTCEEFTCLAFKKKINVKKYLYIRGIVWEEVEGGGGTESI
jgi:hypothetical protein